MEYWGLDQGTLISFPAGTKTLDLATPSSVWDGEGDPPMELPSLWGTGCKKKVSGRLSRPISASPCQATCGAPATPDTGQDTRRAPANLCHRSGYLWSTCIPLTPVRILAGHLQTSDTGQDTKEELEPLTLKTRWISSVMDSDSCKGYSISWRKW